MLLTRSLLMTTIPVLFTSTLPQNTISETYDSSNTIYWRLSDKLQKALRLLYEENYAQFSFLMLHLLYP